MVINLCNLKHNTWRLTSVWGLCGLRILTVKLARLPPPSVTICQTLTFLVTATAWGLFCCNALSLFLPTGKQTGSKVFFCFRFFVFVCLCLAPVASLSAQRLNLSFSQCISFPQGRQVCQWIPSLPLSLVPLQRQSNLQLCISLVSTLYLCIFVCVCRKW